MTKTEARDRQAMRLPYNPSITSRFGRLKALSVSKGRSTSTITRWG